MGLWDKFKGELIDIIEWLDSSRNTLVYRFERYNNEIKYGAKLVVREGQAAVFVNEGRVADVFEPGTYTLETQNLPILGTLKGWKYGFNSPFKAEVYFVSTQQFTDLKWGTKNPVMLRDAEFGPIRVRAYGTYAMRIDSPEDFLKELVSTNARFQVEDITDQTRNIIVSRFTDLLGESKIPILDLASNYDELGDFLTDRIAPDFIAFGLGLTKLLVENISLPPEVEKTLDERSSMGILGNLNQYTQFQAAKAMEAAAKNPGGGASDGMGMGMGFAMAQQMANAMNPQNQAPQAPQAAPAPSAHDEPPPLPGAVSYYAGINGQKAGPFNAQQMQAQIHSGAITPETLVWKKGMSDWQPANQVADLKNLFEDVPPPLPPKF
ncbi:MAG: SPFH domain-containing protein [Acidobacteria bacterium]|nr:SPFH domain-containing protein [Acidobacteriota bacterium]MCB9398720.1 SPFH domain-containing protein [Acidobacteriota bacterium]